MIIVRPSAPILLLVWLGGGPIATAVATHEPRRHAGAGRRGLGFVPPRSRMAPSVRRTPFAGRFSAPSQAARTRLHRTASTVQGAPRDREETGAANQGFEPRSLLERAEDEASKPVIADDLWTVESTTQQSSIQRRHFLLASLALAAQLGLPSPSAALDAPTRPVLTEKRNYQQSPINKRYGNKLSEPERIYPLAFITYLARFLLVFDDECQRWWYAQATALPANGSKEDVERIRLRQFGQFAASVEVGLTDFEGKNGEGVTKLLDSLVKRYGPATAGDGAPERDRLRAKEALRQIGLLFALLGEYQPVEAITQILAAGDDARIERVLVLDGGAGYPPPADGAPAVAFPAPPALAGATFGGSVAGGTAIMKETGRVWRVEVTRGGRGYATAPRVQISFPTGVGGDVRDARVQATARAILGKKGGKGSVERVEILEPGAGYAAGDAVVVAFAPPESMAGGGAVAAATAVLEYEVVSVAVADAGGGYCAEKAVKVVIAPPPPADGRGRPAVAVSYPTGRATSYRSFVGSGAYAAGAGDATQWATGPTSSQLLALLPSGFGLQYDDALGRYLLSRFDAAGRANGWDDVLGGSLEGQRFKPLNPIFGIRGRSPIEKAKTLDGPSVARFLASGAICSSIAHLSLTPLDVVKTKMQTRPDDYNLGIGGNFRKVLDEEGADTFLDGWEPTFVGFFFAGAAAFFLTEFFRRYYTTLVVTAMITQQSLSEAGAAQAVSSFEIPLIVASAATSAFFCCFLLAPFDAVRIRTVSQPDYADNIFGVVARMVKEEGALSLFSAVPVWFTKEIPFNIMKFLVFDTSTEYMYETFPAAREDIRLSLLVSLFGGTLGGIAAAVISNPADVVVSELKKSKTEMSPFEAVDIIKERGGISAFGLGVGLRMIFYSLLVSLQFLLYDTVRIALGVGTDDMKLYLNVLKVALNEKVNQ